MILILILNLPYLFILSFEFSFVICLQGRKGICDGKDASMVFDEEIQELVEKLEKLQRRSGVKDLEGRKCSNLDRQVSLLQRGLKNFGGESDEKCVKEIQEVAEASMSIKTNCSVHETFASNRSCNVMFNLSLLKNFFSCIIFFVLRKLDR
jgi:hypothetical protein